MEQLTNVATLITIAGAIITAYMHFKKHPININKSLIEKRIQQFDRWLSKPLNVITYEGTPQFTISPRAIGFIITELCIVYILITFIGIGVLKFMEGYLKGKTFKGLLVLMCAIGCAFGFTEYIRAMTNNFKDARLNKIIPWLIFTLIPFFILNYFFE